MKFQPGPEPKNPQRFELYVWWVPQVPMQAFWVPVATPLEAKRVLDTLAEYDKFQLEQNIKPDYANAGGLSVYTGKEWEEWEDADGRQIDEIPMHELEEMNFLLSNAAIKHGLTPVSLKPLGTFTPVDLRTCSGGERLISRWGAELTYIKAEPDDDFPHRVRYSDGTEGTRLDNGQVFLNRRLPHDHDIVKIER